MSAFAKILCPVDFSPPSAVAMRHAAGLCKQLGAELTLLHVFELPSFASVPAGQSALATTSIAESMRRVAEQLAADLRTLVAQLDTGAPIQTLLRDGIAHQVIVTTAQELGSDLIVIGSQGHSALARVLLGSVAERVLRNAHCPVLTVPAPGS